MNKLGYYLEWARSTWFGTLYQEKYCPLWDRKLNELLDEYEDTAILGECCIILGSTEVWVSNRFYSYGYVVRVRGLPRRRPSIQTMVRLAILQDSLKGGELEAEAAKYRKLLEDIK